MRAIKEEQWVTEDDHLFVGSGGTSSKHGVAILIHKKWKRHVVQFRPINERVAYVDVERGKFKIRIISAYFPHSGYSDTHVQELYDILNKVIRDARKKKMHILLGSDCNAQVGGYNEQDDSRSVGRYGLEPGNTRGQWLKSWAAVNNMVITNTHFKKLPHKVSTYLSPAKVEKQLDYILVDRKFWKTVTNVESTNAVDLGSDHKSLHLRSKCLCQKKRQCCDRPRNANRKIRKERTDTQWPPQDMIKYCETLDIKLADVHLLADLEAKCTQIEQALITATTISNEGRVRMKSLPSPSDSLQSLLETRRLLPNRHSAERGRISKQIQKEVRATKRLERRAKIDAILQEFKNIKNISRIKERKKKDVIISMVDSNGSIEYNRQSIADVFAQFYEDLYSTTKLSNTTGDGFKVISNPIDEFTISELEAAIKSLKRGRAKDSNGIVAEMIKTGGPVVTNVLLELFNEIIKPNASAPSSWKKVVIKVLFKSGDPKLPQNYRPIAIIPILYKLFAKLIYNRLEPNLDREQSSDQAGFRHRYSTEDHLLTATLIQEIADEYQVPLWVATLDFKKAFDVINHESLWNALRQQGIQDGYINLLQQLYANQTGVVQTDVTSRRFSIQQGVKQGDPLSSLLFNALSESMMRTLKQKWAAAKYGIRLCPIAGWSLTNLRFADDILLYSTSLSTISQMIKDVSEEGVKHGLRLHPDKTKILHNGKNRCRPPAKTNIDGMSIDILKPTDSTKYLGKKLTFAKPHQTEIENRIAAAWRKFYALKHELTSSCYSLSDRLRLFQGVITPTVLYGSASWTMTVDLENQLKRTHRQMIRMILASPRRVLHGNVQAQHTHDDDPEDDTSKESGNKKETLEPWIDWVKRCTHTAEAKLAALGLEEWVITQKQRQWRWAYKIANDVNKWSHLAAQWEPSIDLRCNARRKPGRPKKKWSDNIVEHIKKLNGASEANNLDYTCWQSVAKDHFVWYSMEPSSSNIL